MPNEELSLHLKEKVEYYLDMYNRKRQLNKFLAFGIKLASAFLAAMITVLLGLDYPDKPDQLFSNIALGLSALIFILNTWDTFFSHKSLWFRFNNAYVDMHLLQTDLEYAIIKNNGELQPDEANQLHARVTSIVRTTNEEWQELRREAKERRQIDTQ